MEFKSVGHLLVSYVEQSWRYFNAYETGGEGRRELFASRRAVPPLPLCDRFLELDD